MTGFEQLERELLAAERRLSREAPNTRRSPRRRLPLRMDSVAIGLAITIACAVAAVAIVVAGHRPSSEHAARQKPSSIQRLVDELGVLRSPQTAAARRWLEATEARRLTGAGRLRPIASSVRALALPDHERLILYLVNSSQFGVSGLGYRANGEGGCCVTAEELNRPVGPGPLSWQSGRIPPQVYYEIVPDGVTKVRWTFARRGRFGYTHVPPSVARRLAQLHRPPPKPGFIGDPNSAPLTVTVAVHDNVAAMLLPNRGAAISDTWFNAAGHVIAGTAASGTG